MSTETRASRPAAADSSPARRLRGLIGVQEESLDWVPSDRPRYTTMSVIVLTTGVLGGLSMLAVASGLFTGWFAWPAAVAIAGVWGFALITLDRWLIAGMHGARARALACLPRLLITVMLGLVMAEPLLVIVFRPAIAQEVADPRHAELAA